MPQSPGCRRLSCACQYKVGARIKGGTDRAVLPSRLKSCSMYDMLDEIVGVRESRKETGVNEIDPGQVKKVIGPVSR